MLEIAADKIIEDYGIGYFRELSTFGALSDDVILDLLRRGRVVKLDKGEYVARYDEEVSEFQVVLSGRLAYYKRYEGHDVLTRYFGQGEQVGFDLMIGLLHSDGTDVAVEDSLLLNISSQLFYDLHVDHPAEFTALASSPETVENRLDRDSPMPRSAAMAATETSAAIRPYSMAVAPDSSFANLRIAFNMVATSYYRA